MLTNEINEFHVISTIERPDKTPRVLLENKKLKKQIEVSGKVLEAQCQISKNFLVLVTEGNPFEEALYIYYFNAGLQIMDSLELSVIYAEGMLRNIFISDSGEIIFSFFDTDEQWILKVYSKPKYEFFHNKYPVKRKTSIFHKKWLSLTKAECQVPGDCIRAF